MRRWYLFVVVVAAVLVSSPVTAQSVDVTVNGQILDESRAVLPGVTITATNTNTSVARSALTDRTGHYTILTIPAGTYDVKAELAGFATEIRHSFVLYVGTTVTIDFALKVAAVAEIVEVTARATPLEVTKNTLARTVQSTEIDGLPVINRSFSDLAALAPGVVQVGGGLAISGNRVFQNALLVDGVSAERQSMGDQRMGFAQDWIQEFQVMTGQYNAEFGQASGGVLNVITRSGSNTVSGRFYGFFRNEAWDARNYFATSKPPLAQTRLGGTVGGPVIKSKLFYFGGVEYYRTESSSIVKSTFPSANGAFPALTHAMNYMGKGDYHLSPAHAVRARVTVYRGDTTGAGIGGTGTEEHGGFGHLKPADAIGNWNWIASSHALNEVRVAWSRFWSQSGCNFATRNPIGTWYERAYPGATFGCPVNFGLIGEDQLQLIENHTVVKGRHEFKAGGQLVRTRFYADFRNIRDGRYAFERDIPFSLADPNSYPYLFMIIEGPTAYDVPSWAGGMFVQDSWRVTDDVALNFGLRYDLDGTLTALNPMVRADQGMHTVSTDKNNVAPRVGISWTPLQRNKNLMIRGGVGLYYDENHNNVAGITLLNNIMVDRTVTINANSSFQNPWWPDRNAAKAFLAASFARNSIPDVSSLGSVAGATNDLAADLQIPRTTQASLGFAVQLAHNLHVTTDVVIARGSDLLVAANTNITPDGLRINPNYTSILTLQNGGWNRYDALQVQANWIPSAKRFVKLSYTLAKNTDNTTTSLNAGGATNPYDFDEDAGAAATDVRHVVAVNGVTSLPWGIQAAGILNYRTALPWSVSTPLQLDTDPWTDRPEPRNSRRGDDQFSLDARFSEVVRLRGRRSITAFAEVFNITNSVSLSGYVSSVLSSSFGQATVAGSPRRTQLGFRIDF